MALLYSILNVKDAGMRMVSIQFVGADACRRPLQMFFKAIPHNSKCRYGERGAADAVPQLPERCLSRKAGIVRCCLSIETRQGPGGLR